MSTILRTIRNLRKIGIKEYAHQMQYMGDTKAGTYIASDRYGNKYYENIEEELPRKSSHDFESKKFELPMVHPAIKWSLIEAQ